jgi:preprotein translocase subunit SecD
MIRTRRGFLATLFVLGASGMASAQSAAIPDGIYLVTDNEEDDGIWLPFQGLDHEELVRRERLMTLEVASAEAEFDENWGAPIILVTFAESQRETFARLTEKYLDQRLALVVGGVIIVAPYVHEPIRGGQLQIGAHGNLGAAVAVADALRSARPN